MIYGVVNLILFFITGVCTVISFRKYESEVKYWMNNSDEALTRNVQLADRIFVLNDEAIEYESTIDRNLIIINELRSTIRQLSNITDICPHCDSTELICGHNGRGCTHENDEIEEQEEMML